MKAIKQLDGSVEASGRMQYLPEGLRFDEEIPVASIFSTRSFLNVATNTGNAASRLPPRSRTCWGLSGDRHLAEICRLKKDETKLPFDLYDMTCSGLTHAGSPKGRKGQIKRIPGNTGVNCCIRITLNSIG